MTLKRVGVISILFIVVFLPLSACSTPVTQQLTAQDYLDFGEKYLLELDYEQALVQFLKVIGIDPMNPRGYTGAAEAYVGMGDISNAISVLEQGLALLLDNSSISALLEKLLFENNDEPSLTLTAEIQGEQPIEKPITASTDSDNPTNNITRRGTEIMGYIDLPADFSMSKSYADELPEEELRITQSTIVFRNFRFRDYFDTNLVPPANHLTVIIRRELRGWTDIDLAIGEYPLPQQRFFKNISEEDCNVGGYTGKLIKHDDCIQDVHLYFAGDSMHSYVFINDDASTPFVIEVIWNPKTSDHDIADLISTYRFDN